MNNIFAGRETFGTATGSWFYNDANAIAGWCNNWMGGDPSRAGSACCNDSTNINAEGQYATLWPQETDGPLADVTWAAIPAAAVGAGVDITSTFSCEGQSVGAFEWNSDTPYPSGTPDIGALRTVAPMTAGPTFHGGSITGGGIGN